MTKVIVETYLSIIHNLFLGLEWFLSESTLDAIAHLTPKDYETTWASHNQAVIKSSKNLLVYRWF